MQSLLSNTCDLFSRIFEVFSQIEINVINNKIFTKLKLKIRVRGKEYHFLVESKPHERTDLLPVDIYQTKKSISIVMKTCLRKTDEAIWEIPTPF